MVPGLVVAQRRLAEDPVRELPRRRPTDYRFSRPDPFVVLFGIRRRVLVGRNMPKVNGAGLRKVRAVRDDFIGLRIPDALRYRTRPSANAPPMDVPGVSSNGL
jgi:hypothetical protein